MSDLHCEVRDCCGDVPLDDMCGRCFQIQASINDRDKRIAELEGQLKDRHKRMDALHKANANHLDAWVDNDMTIALRKRAEAAEAALERVRGLPDRVRERMDNWALRINYENGRMVPPPDGVDGEWITVRMANKMIRDELAAALKEEGK